jgi:hypothetical protein
MPERVRTASVGQSHFDVMGVPPYIGRTFNADDFARDIPTVAILNYDLWMRRYGGDRSLIGRTIETNGRRLTVVGVMPQNSMWPTDAQIFLPDTRSDTRRHK